MVALDEAQQWIGPSPGARTSLVALDLTSLAGVRTAAAAIAELAPSIAC